MRLLSSPQTASRGKAEAASVLWQDGGATKEMNQRDGMCRLCRRGWASLWFRVSMRGRTVCLVLLPGRA